MIEIKYTVSPQESAAATVDFMCNRPIMASILMMMKILCILLCAAYGITVYNHAARPQDLIAVLCAVGWLLFYKKMNRWVIQRGMQLRKFADLQCICKMDEKSILYSLHHNNPQHIEWKKLKYVLKNANGYIIPLTGLANAGRFLWLPLRSLQNQADEQAFINILQKFNLKLRQIS